MFFREMSNRDSPSLSAFPATDKLQYITKKSCQPEPFLNSRKQLTDGLYSLTESSLPWFQQAEHSHIQGRVRDVQETVGQKINPRHESRGNAERDRGGYFRNRISERIRKHFPVQSCLQSRNGQKPAQIPLKHYAKIRIRMIAPP